MLVRRVARIEQIPQLGALIFRLPLTKAVTVAKNALLGACLLFIAPCAANQSIKTELFNRFQERDRLMRIARFVWRAKAHRATRHRVFHATHNEFCTQFFRAQITEICHFFVVMTRINHQKRVRQPATACFGAKGFFCAFEQHERIFAARK